MAANNFFPDGLFICGAIIAACFAFPVYLLIRDALPETKRPPSVPAAPAQKQAELELKVSETALESALAELGLDGQVKNQEFAELLDKPTSLH